MDLFGIGEGCDGSFCHCFACLPFFHLGLVWLVD